MDNGYRAKLEREIEAHSRKIAQLAQDLRDVEELGRLLRIALRGREAARELAIERLVQECLTMKSLIRG